MSPSNKRIDWLARVLLIAVLVELVIYRLAGRTLRPSGDEEPALWHHVLESVGLYVFYFSTVFAGAVLLIATVRSVREKEIALPLVIPLALAVATLLTYCLLGVSATPSSDVSFMIEMSYAAILIATVIGFALRSGDLGVRIGIWVLAVPLLVHGVEAFVLTQYIDQLGNSDLPETLESTGRWSLIFSASLSPYCFAPRPFMRSATRPIPLVLAAFTGFAGALILHRQFDVGAELASYGLGINLGPGMPAHQMALAIMALAAMSWTISSCLAAASTARRTIGVGIALVVLAGYGFGWPLQFLLGGVGILIVASAGRRVVAQEAEARAEESNYRPPPIAEETWHNYANAIIAELRDNHGATHCNVVTAGSDEERRTHFVAELRGLDLKLSVIRRSESIAVIEIAVASPPYSGETADWSIYAKPERRLGSHPRPPLTHGVAIKTGDDPFDQRFHMKGSTELAERLLDDGLRARAAALLDGWTAFWEDRGLRFQVCPGRGAPIDNPIPITELAFRGPHAPTSVDRLVALVTTLCEITERGLEDSE